jgi:hypothetical protein
MISPVVAGGGRQRLFPDDAAPATFELAEATPGQHRRAHRHLPASQLAGLTPGHNGLISRAF